MSNISKEEMDEVVSQAYSSLGKNGGRSPDDKPKTRSSARDARRAEEFKKSHDSNLRLVRGLGKGVTSTFDLLSYPANALLGNGWKSAGLTDDLNEYFGDIGEDDLYDNAAEVASSLVTGAGGRKAISKAASYIPHGKEIAQKIGEYTPGIVKKGASFLGNSVFNKDIKTADVLGGVAAIKGSEAAADALKDLDINPYLKGAGTVAAGLGSSMATSNASNLARVARNKALENMLDLDKVERNQKYGLKNELARVVDDNSMWAAPVRRLGQAAADLPFASTTNLNRAKVLDDVQDMLLMPKPRQFVNNAEESSEVIRSGFNKEKKALNEILDPHLEQAGLLEKSNPEFEKYINSKDNTSAARAEKGGSKQSPSHSEDFIPFDQANESEKIRRINAVETKGRKLLNEALNSDLSDGEVIDSVYKQITSNVNSPASQKSVSDLTLKEFDAAYDAAAARNPKHDPHESFEEKKRFIEENSTHLIPSQTVMKHGEERFNPTVTRKLLNSFKNEYLSEPALYLKKVLEHAPNKDINVKTMREAIIDLNNLNIPESMPTKEKNAIYQVREAATEELANALHAIDPKAKEGYDKFRKVYDGYRQENPKAHINKKLYNPNFQKGKGHEDTVISNEMGKKGVGYALRAVSPHLTQEESKTLLPHLWKMLGNDINQMRKVYSDLDLSKRNVFKQLITKALGKDIDIEDVFKVTDEFPKVLNYKNKSGSGNTIYINDFSKEIGEAVSKAATDQKGMWKGIKNLIAGKILPALGGNYINNSEYILNHLIKINKARSPSEGIFQLKNISKTGVIPPAVMDHIISSVQDAFKKKKVDDDQ